MNHPNIIKLREVVKENNELFLIFEYMVNKAFILKFLFIPSFSILYILHLSFISACEVIFRYLIFFIDIYYISYNIVMKMKRAILSIYLVNVEEKIAQRGGIVIRMK